MIRPSAALLLLAACTNTDNLIVGGLAAGATTPDIYFDNIGSAIHGTATLRDAGGNPACSTRSPTTSETRRPPTRRSS